jgi:hypothetical protein
MRAEPSDRAEMVNVVLFGESFDLLEELPKWVKIKLHHDGYEGWLDRLQFRLISEDYFELLSQQKPKFCSETIHLLQGSEPTDYPLITQGSYLPLLDGPTVRLEDKQYTYEGLFSEGIKDRDTLVDIAFSYLNAPYLWGGRTPFGIDCSGFTQMVYRLSGYYLPRDASQQAKKGTTLSFLEECLPGDLAFFDNAEGAITHVGIVLEDFHIIHASGRVRVDSLDHSGIYNSELGRHSHKLRLLKRILP